MPRGRPKGSRSTAKARSTKGLKNAARRRRPCLTCEHTERARIDYLAAKGESLNALARKFGVSQSGLYRHVHNHISSEYRSIVRANPLESLETLQRLGAEDGISVVESLKAVNAFLTNMLATSFEAGDAHRWRY
jgi:hypothetical protein